MAARALEGEGFALRPTSPTDFEFLRPFFGSPLVHEHWGGTPPTDAEIREKYLGARSPGVECFIVDIDGNASGLVQYHKAEDGEGGGLDIVLLPECRGRGLGTGVVQLLATFLREQLEWSRLTVDPDVSNERGVDFWKRAGFETVRVVDDEVGRQPYWLMEWRGDGRRAVP